MKRIEVRFAEGSEVGVLDGEMTEAGWLDCLAELRFGAPEDLIHLPYNTAEAWIIRRHIIAVGVATGG